MSKRKSIKEEIKEDIGKYANLEILKNTEGGKELISYLEENFVSMIDKICSRPKIDEVYVIIAEIDMTLKLLRMFYRAEKNKDLALQALKDEEEKEVVI